MINLDSGKQAVEQVSTLYQSITSELSKPIVGQKEVIEQLLISMFCNGHCLLIGVPGLAKTLLVQSVADVMKLDFKRIQFTPDLMPSDIIGAEILNADRKFEFQKGPIFGNIILADEINRTPPKTQSALLEAMQERKVSAAGTTYTLPEPFFVLATQNPIEQEGTYPLPEAQLDRFLFSLNVDYPSLEDEVEIVKRTTTGKIELPNSVVSAEDVLAIRTLVREMPVNDNVIQYAVELAVSTRPDYENNSLATQYLEWGAGPRASQALILGAKCHALLHGKYSPDIENIKSVAHAVLRHRIAKNYKSEAEGLTSDNIITQLLK